MFTLAGVRDVSRAKAVLRARFGTGSASPCAPRSTAASAKPKTAGGTRTPASSSAARTATATAATSCIRQKQQQVVVVVAPNRVAKRPRVVDIDGEDVDKRCGDVASSASPLVVVDAGLDQSSLVSEDWSVEARVLSTDQVDAASALTMLLAASSTRGSSVRVVHPVLCALRDRRRRGTSSPMQPLAPAHLRTTALRALYDVVLRGNKHHGPPPRVVVVGDLVPGATAGIRYVLDNLVQCYDPSYTCIHVDAPNECHVQNTAARMDIYAWIDRYHLTRNPSLGKTTVLVLHRPLGTQLQAIGAYAEAVEPAPGTSNRKQHRLAGGGSPHRPVFPVLVVTDNPFDATMAPIKRLQRERCPFFLLNIPSHRFVARVLDVSLAQCAVTPGRTAAVQQAADQSNGCVYTGLSNLWHTALGVATASRGATTEHNNCSSSQQLGLFVWAHRTLRGAAPAASALEQHTREEERALFAGYALVAPPPVVTDRPTASLPACDTLDLLAQASDVFSTADLLSPWVPEDVMAVSTLPCAAYLREHAWAAAGTARSAPRPLVIQGMYAGTTVAAPWRLGGMSPPSSSASYGINDLLFFRETAPTDPASPQRVAAWLAHSLHANCGGSGSSRAGTECPFRRAAGHRCVAVYVPCRRADLVDALSTRGRNRVALLCWIAIVLLAGDEAARVGGGGGWQRRETTAAARVRKGHDPPCRWVTLLLPSSSMQEAARGPGVSVTLACIAAHCVGGGHGANAASASTLVSRLAEQWVQTHTRGSAAVRAVLPASSSWCCLSTLLHNLNALVTCHA